MINWFDVSDESPNKDLALKNLKVTQNGTYGESGVAYSSVEVNVSGGGGGSSDFSTAEVTVQITSAQPGVAIYIPTVISSPMEAISNNPYNPTNSSTPQTVTVPLYKGSLIINGIWDSGDVTVDTSGSVQVMESSFLITGDCTITIA